MEWANEEGISPQQQDQLEPILIAVSVEVYLPPFWEEDLVVCYVNLFNKHRLNCKLSNITAIAHNTKVHSVVLYQLTKYIIYFKV